MSLPQGSQFAFAPLPPNPIYVDTPLDAFCKCPPNEDPLHVLYADDMCRQIVQGMPLYEVIEPTLRRWFEEDYRKAEGNYFGAWLLHADFSNIFNFDILVFDRKRPDQFYMISRIFSTMDAAVIIRFAMCNSADIEQSRQARTGTRTYVTLTREQFTNGQLVALAGIVKDLPTLVCRPTGYAFVRYSPIVDLAKEAAFSTTM